MNRTSASPTFAEFAATFGTDPDRRPEWAFAASPPLDSLGIRERLEEVLDTVTALQRADWLEDGVYVGPTVMGDVHASLVHACRAHGIALPPAIAAGAPMRSQGVYGTDARSFVYLSTYYLSGLSEPARRFVLGRLAGQIAARQVTATTLYGMMVDQSGLRAVARRTFGPVLEVVLAPLSVGVRLAMSRWHRSAELSADRAGLLVGRDLDAATTGLLKLQLGMNPSVSREEYLRQLRRSGGERSAPGRWTELLSAQPWTHKRILALEAFANSAMYARLTDVQAEADALSDDDLHQHTSTLLGLGA